MFLTNRLMEKYFVPDSLELEEAKRRVTHLAIGAHQDDLEIFAYHGIAACYESESLWFAGVTVTDGGGSARIGPYQDFTDEAMKAVRHEEQNCAAKIGKYAFQAQLGYPSKAVKNPKSSDPIVEELREIITACSPEVLYLHNPADKHDTHIAVLALCIDALRSVPREKRPKRVLGCEVWRDLDWMDDERKVALPVDQFPELAKDLIAVFESQVVGGKDYVSATLGRRAANATFFDSHAVDAATGFTYALDLTPFAEDDSLTLKAFMEPLLDDFKNDVLSRVQSYVI